MPTSSPSEAAAVHGAQLAFFVGDEEYGVPLARVTEIAPDEGLTRVPGAPELLLGILDVRGVPVAVVDLGRKFGVPAPERATRNSLVVVEAVMGGREALVAIAADRISRVIEPRPEDVLPLPPLSSAIRAPFVLGIVRSERGSVLLLDLELALDATEQEAISGCLAPRDAGRPQPADPEARQQPANPAAGAEVEQAARRFVVVRSGGLRCGVDASWVQDVTLAGSVTSVPGAPASFHGLYNLRGAVVPVLDLAAAMGQPPFSPKERSAYLVLDPPDGQARGVAALAVEAVMGMVEVAADEIDALPAFAPQAPAELFEGHALSLGEPMLILDLAALLAR